MLKTGKKEAKIGLKKAKNLLKKYQKSHFFAALPQIPPPKKMPQSGKIKLRKTAGLCSIKLFF
jgi:hypothetical protein